MWWVNWRCQLVELFLFVESVVAIRIPEHRVEYLVPDHREKHSSVFDTILYLTVLIHYSAS